MTLLELLQLVRKHLRLTVLLPVVCALATGAYSFLFMANEYTATTDVYVLSTSSSSGTNAEGPTSTDLSASQMLTNDVAQIIQSERVKRDTADQLQMSSLAGYDISVTSETTTRVIQLSVTGHDAPSCSAIANALVENASKAAQEVMDVESINTIDQAEVPDAPSGPNRPLYTAVAFLAGLFLAVAVIVLMDMLNTRIRNAEDAEATLGVPVIGRIPATKEGK